MQATKTTIHLKLPDVRKAWNLPAPIFLAICVMCAAGIIAAIGRIQNTPAPMPDPIIIIATAPAVQPVIVIQRQQAPTAVPPTPQVIYVTGPTVYVSVPAARLQSPEVDQVYRADSEPIVPQAAPPIVMDDEQQAAVDREFGLTDADKAQALAEHNAQQAAWCADKVSEYCDMVRAGQ